MPIYEFKCTAGCGNIEQYRISIQAYSKIGDLDMTCLRCRRGAMVRKFSFAIKPSMPDHYNTSAGTYVSSERQLNDEFKRLSDEASARVGMEHRFVPVDPRDKDRLGVTDAGLKETYDRRKQLGMKIPEVVRPENMT